MQLKKLLQGSVFAAAAAVCVLAAPGVAQAAEVTGTFTEAGVGDVTVDGTTATMEAKMASGKAELLVGFGKVNAKKKTITVASWDSYQPAANAAAKIDLSKLSNVKDNYIVLTTPGADAVSVVKIPAVDKAIAATFDAGKGQLSVGTAKTGKPTAAPLTGGEKGTALNYEYRTSYSDWTDLSEGTGSSATVLDLTRYQQEGAKLFVRAKAGTITLQASSAKQGDEELTYGEQKAKVYDGASLPGKEKAVTIAAMAKGPKVTADYVKGTVKFPKNSEYRVITKDTNQKISAAGKYVDGTTTATNVADIFKAANDKDSSLGIQDTTASLTLEVRTKATDKKAASKWTNLVIDKPLAIATTTTTGGEADKILVGAIDSTTREPASNIEKGKKVTYGGKGVKDSTLGEGESKNILSIDYDTKLKNNLKLVIENKGKKAYEFVVVGAGATPTGSEKALKAAAGKKVTLQKLTDKQEVYVRIAGDKKAKTWVGGYTKLGPVDAPVTVEGTKETTSAS